MDYILPKLIVEIEKLPYYDGKSFENACQEVFEKCGFINMSIDGENIFKQFEWCDPPCEQLPSEKTLIKQDRFDELRFLELYDDHLYYLPQPCGTSNPPDFLLIIYGQVVPFECKSSASRKYRFNNTLPHASTIYAFSDQYHNKTRLAMGRDLINPTAAAKIEDITRQKLAKMYREIKEETKDLPGNPYNFSGYGRPQHDQSHGGYEVTDFVTLSEKNNWRVGVLFHLLCTLRKSKYWDLPDAFA